MLLLDDTVKFHAGRRVDAAARRLHLLHDRAARVVRGRTRATPAAAAQVQYHLNASPPLALVSWAKFFRLLFY